MENTETNYTQAFNQILKASNSAFPLKKILNSIAKTASKAMSAAGCSVMLLSPQSEHLTIIAAVGLSDLYLRKGILNANKSLPKIMEGKIVSITDITKQKQAQYPEAAKTENIKSILGIPLMQRNEIIGEIRIYTEDIRHFSHKDKDFLSCIANIVSLVIERSELRTAIDSKPEKYSRKISQVN